MGDFLSNIGNSIGNTFHQGVNNVLNMINSVKPVQPVQAQTMPMNQAVQQMQQNGWKLSTPSASSTPQPQLLSSPTPQAVMPSPAANSNVDGFKYQMGLKDYSFVKPQLQALFQAKGNPPLAQNIDDFIQAGNRHNVDPRALVTIANNESSLGRNYPTNSYNPFGYGASSSGYIKGPDGKMYVNTDQGLKDAGFTSLPMAIDRLTQRLSDHPFNPTPAAYATFRQNPTISNLQQAFNANPAERDNYLNKAKELLQYFK